MYTCYMFQVKNHVYDCFQDIVAISAVVIAEFIKLAIFTSI